MENMKNIVITKIHEAASVYSPKGRLFQMQKRYCYGLSFCLSGQITYTHNGQEFVSCPDNAIILPQGVSYTLHGDKTGIFPLINFECAEFLTDTFLVYPIGNKDSFIRDFEQIKALSLSGENRIKTMSILYDMIYRLYSSKNVSGTILPAIKYIENNYKNSDLSNIMLANKCHISEVYLRKLFIKHFNATPKQYVSDIRLQKAKQLLSEGVLKINAVASECGFSSTYHFSRFFRAKVGITPSEYAKQNPFIKI